MDATIAKLWVEALRSGEYKQAKGKLRYVKDGKTVGFCCLGVLCNLHAQAHPEIAKYETYPHSYLGNTATLPVEVLDWAGIGTEHAFFGGTSLGGTSLVRLNDDGVKFEQIAEIIEANRVKL